LSGNTAGVRITPAAAGSIAAISPTAIASPTIAVPLASPVITAAVAIILAPTPAPWLWRRPPIAAACILGVAAFLIGPALAATAACQHVGGDHDGEKGKESEED